MAKYDLEANHISEVKMENFVDMSNPLGTQNATIKVGKNTYKVKIDAKGNVEVDFAKYRLGNLLFRRRTKARMLQQIQNQVADWRKKMTERNGHRVVTEVSENLNEALLDNKFEMSPSGKAETHQREIAVYGFSNMRGLMKKIASDDHHITQMLIDGLNLGLGLDPNTLKASGIQNTVDEIRNGTRHIGFSERLLKNDKELSFNYPDERLHQWAEFLQRPENIKKIDVFGRIKDMQRVAQNPNRYKNASGWNGMIATKGLKKTLVSMVKKNLPGIEIEPIIIGTKKYKIDNKMINMMADSLVEISNIEGERTKEKLDAAIRTAGRRNGYPTMSNNLVDAVSQKIDMVIGNMFFRQTSKLGLDFFNEKQIPILFYFSNYKGYEVNTNNKAVTDKWWKRDNESINDHYGAPITFSEMRHLEKMMAKKKQANKNNDLINLDSEDMHQNNNVNVIKVKGIKINKEGPKA